jgi:hypothetical protein
MRELGNEMSAWRPEYAIPCLLWESASPSAFSGTNPPPRLPELAESLQQLHCRFVFELISFEFASIQTLQVRREGNAFSTSRIAFLPYRVIAAPISIRTLSFSLSCSFPSVSRYLTKG